MSNRELGLVAPLVQTGILPAAEANACLQAWQRLQKEGRNVSLLAVLVKKGLLTRTQALVLADAALERSQPFPSYRLLRKVGEGGMALVYEATYEPLNARVALKILKTEFGLQERYRLRFKREAHILLALDHKGLVDGREYATADGVDFYAMGFVDGISMLDVLDRAGPPAEGIVLDIVCQVGEALAHMHEKGIVHRDVKPANVVVDQEGAARIIDFGLALVVQGMREDTAESMTVGTPEYMSPEQARGDRVDGRADVYSLGVSLFHMLTGDVPFGGSPEEVLVAQVKQDVAFTPVQMSRISPPVQFVIRKAMAKDPALRYGTAEEMVEDIRDVAAGVLRDRPPLPEVIRSGTIEEAPLSDEARRSGGPAHRAEAAPVATRPPPAAVKPSP